MVDQTAPDDVQVVVTLAYPPTWYKPVDYWTTHQYDDFRPEDPYEGKPHIQLGASFPDTLAEVIDRASEGLGIAPGPSNQASSMSEFVARIAFYESEDDLAFDIQRMYQSPRELPVVNADGTVELKSWRDVTVLELLVSSRFDLIAGDPLRPYVCASIPQGSFSPDLVVEGLRFGAEAVSAAIHLISTSKEGLHEADRYVSTHPVESAAAAGTARWIGKRFRGRRKSKGQLRDRHADSEEGEERHD